MGCTHLYALVVTAVVTPATPTSGLNHAGYVWLSGCLLVFSLTQELFKAAAQLNFANDKFRPKV